LEVGGLPRGIHDDRYRRLIEALAEARRFAGLTQVELAQRLGKRQQFVSKYESGERRLDVVEFADIGRALGLDLTSLITAIPAAE
jgi:transcriptional regulator with XRE-family HTH domain